MSSKKDLLPILKKLKEQGFEVQPTKSTHWRVVSPAGRRCNIPATPSNHRQVKNITTRLRRIGFRP